MALSVCLSVFTVFSAWLSGRRSVPLLGTVSTTNPSRVAVLSARVPVQRSHPSSAWRGTHPLPANVTLQRSRVSGTVTVFALRDLQADAPVL